MGLLAFIWLRVNPRCLSNKHLRILWFCCSVAKLCLDSLPPHGLQQARLPCPPLSPRACSNSWPLSLWCHPTISASVVPFSSRLQSCPESGSFPVCWLFTSDGQSIGASASASVLPVNIQGWFLLGSTGFIFLKSKGLSRVFSAPQFKDISSSVLSLLYSLILTSVYDYWKNHSFDYMDLCWQSDASAF